MYTLSNICSLHKGGLGKLEHWPSSKKSTSPNSIASIAFMLMDIQKVYEKPIKDETFG